MRRYLLTIIGLYFSFGALAQDYAFKVLVSKGKNEIKSGTTWEPIKVGTTLKSPDELKVTENAYIGLIHVSGKPLELKTAGKYKIADLSAKVGSSTSVLNKYTDFILSTNTQKQNKLSATGAVHRGIDIVDVFLPPSSSYIYGDTVIIEWEKNPEISVPYEVIFSNLFGEELYKAETSENTITVDLAAPEFARETDISLKVVSKKSRKESETYTLRKFSKNDREKVKATFSELARETSEKNALNHLVKAAFFEQNKLFADAVTEFRRAISLEPAVQMYKDSYEDFLQRNRLKEPPAKK